MCQAGTVSPSATVPRYANLTPFVRYHTHHLHRYPPLFPQHPVLASKMKTCSFNATHIVPAAELTVHEGQCENRMALLEVMYSSSNGSRIIDNTSPVTTQADMEPRVEEPSQENW